MKLLWIRDAIADAASMLERIRNHDCVIVRNTLLSSWTTLCEKSRAASLIPPSVPGPRREGSRGLASRHGAVVVADLEGVVVPLVLDDRPRA